MRTAWIAACLALVASWTYWPASLVAIAAAEPALNGVFTAQYPSGTSTWTITSQCSNSGCTAHVVSSSGWRRDAQFSGRQWTLGWLDRADGMVCPDGTTAPANVVWTWDAQTLTGTVSITHGAGCGNPPTPPGILTEPFALLRID